MEIRKKTGKILKAFIIMNGILGMALMLCYVTSNRRRTYTTLK